jgi:hypothetical protein
MRLRFLALPGLMLCCCAAALAASTPPAGKSAPAKKSSTASHGAAKPVPLAESAPKGRSFVGAILDSGQFLPDTFVICRVGPRATRVGQYIRDYFDSYMEYRPAQDSAGRVEFLQNLVNKDLLGQIALEINRPMTFEDRVALRETEQRTLSNALYKTAVIDSLDITEDDIRREYESFRYEVRLRRIPFADRATAERVRLDLLRGRTTWKAAYDRFATTKSTDKKPDGEIGWMSRGGADLQTARKVFSLGPGGTSEVLEQQDGWVIVQVMEKREGSPPALEAVRNILHDQLSMERIAARGDVIRALVRKQIGMVYDSTQIKWASSRYLPTQSSSPGEGGRSQLTFNTVLPEFSSEDTARVLARYRDGVFTLGRFQHAYMEIQPLVRPPVDTPEGFRAQVDGFVFEPYMATVAKERGLDKDSTVVAAMSQKREQLLVEHLYSDSIQSRVAVDSKARHKYYQDNLRGFVTWAKVRFASLWAPSRADAESLEARLKAGEKAEDIIRADSLLGIDRGSIQERAENEHLPYQKQLFEELRPGMTAIYGPDKVKHYLVIQELEFIPGRQLSYEESENMIDESLQNMESERLLKAFIERHKKRYPIATRPDLVMRIRLVDPSL